MTLEEHLSELGSVEREAFSGIVAGLRALPVHAPSDGFFARVMDAVKEEDGKGRRATYGGGIVRRPSPAVWRGIGVAASAVPMNFKDLIETKAEEHNIVFMPVIGKRHEGKQLYTFGRIVIYIDRGVVFVQGEKTWVPTSLQSLIDMAK